MSWEDCGCKPGKIDGPERCPRKCGDCDGEHHFVVATDEGNGEEPDIYFACKHCDATAEMVPDDDDMDEGIGLGDDMGPVMRGTDWHDDD